MAQATRVGVKQLVEEARREIEEVEPAEAIGMVGDDGVLIVDIRDVRELTRDGRIPGSFHCPRGMLEFWIDPESPYYKSVFGEGKRVLFHCAADWRSALATQTAQRMGLAPVAHIKGGLKAWKEAGGPIELPEA